MGMDTTTTTPMAMTTRIEDGGVTEQAPTPTLPTRGEEAKAHPRRIAKAGRSHPFPAQRRAHLSHLVGRPGGWSFAHRIPPRP